MTCLHFKILVNYTIEENSISLSLAGTNKNLKKYLQFVKRAEKDGLIDLELKSYYNKHQNFPKIKKEVIVVSRPKKKPIVSDEIVSKVSSLLPQQPWKTGIHKEIAQKLGLKNREVTTAIDILIKNGDYKNQHDGIVTDINRYAKRNVPE